MRVTAGSVAALAAVAVVTVLATTVATVVQLTGSGSAGPTDPSPPQPVSSSAAPTPSVVRPEPRFVGGQLLRSDDPTNLVLEVPSRKEGWEVTSTGVSVEATERPGQDGWKAVRLFGPAVYEAGFCPRRPNLIRAYVGFFRADDQPEGLDRVNRDDAERWAAAVVWGDRRRIYQKTRWVSRIRPFRMLDGTVGRLSVAVVGGATGQRRCQAPEMELRVLTRDIGDGELASVVLVRDLGTADELSETRVEDILSTVRLQRLPESPTASATQ